MCASSYTLKYPGPRTPARSCPSFPQHPRDRTETVVPVGEDSFFVQDHPERTLQRMEAFLLHQRLCDVVLVVGSERIPAHRLVLSAVSDYFAAMFTSEVREARQNEVRMEAVDPAALWALVHYAYTGRLELHEETVEELLSAACLLQLQPAVQVCCAFLLRQLHPANCLGVRAFADSLGCTRLLAAAHSYTMDHFTEVIGHQEFMLLPPSEVEQLLSSDDINVPDEETIFNALMAWTRHDLEARHPVLARLLAHVRLPLLSPQFLAELETNPLFREELECQRLVLEAMKYHLVPEMRQLLQSPRTRPRAATVGAMFAVGGMDAGKGPSTMERFDLRTGRWLPAGAMPGRRLQFGTAVISGHLYVVGGREGLKTLGSVDCYDPVRGSWSSMPAMSTHRHGLGVAVLEGPMYAIGGHDGWSYLCTVERWDPQTRRWRYVANMAAARSTVGVSVLNGKLYAAGGRDGSSCLSSVERFDPHTNSWSPCAPLSSRRGGVGLAACNGFLYAVGGHDAPTANHASRLLASVERYNPKTDSWSKVAPMGLARDAVAACLLGGRLYAVGGYDGQAYLERVEAYDTVADEWVQVASLGKGRAGACVVVIKLT